MPDNSTLFCGKCWEGPRGGAFCVQLPPRACTLCTARTPIGRNKPRSKNDPNGNELAAHARAFSLPSLREEPRADLNKGLRVVQEMLGIFGHDLDPPFTPILTRKHCLRKRTGCGQLRGKFRGKIRLCLHAVEPQPVCLLKPVQLFGLRISKLLNAPLCLRGKVRSSQIEYRELLHSLTM